VDVVRGRDASRDDSKYARSGGKWVDHGEISELQSLKM
jgi:hypothetical protein